MNPALRGSLAVLLLRLITGVAFIAHGWGKIQNPFHWLDATAHPPPSFLQALAALAEFGGGIGLLLGLLTPICAGGLFLTMAYAVVFHVLKGDPFAGKGGGSYELALVYLTLSVAFVLLGPGRFSLDQIIANRTNPQPGNGLRDSLHARLR